MKRNYKAILTIHDLDTMSDEEVIELKQWLCSLPIKIIGDRNKFSKLVRFKLMK